MSDRILKEKGLVVRHSLVERIEHWTIALSGLSLLITGMFELPLANRYYITSVPGLGWSGDFVTTLTFHYAASVVFIAASVFHLLYHGILGERGMLPRAGDLKMSVEVVKSFFGKAPEPPFHKYLPEQRLAYAGMAVIIAILILSGLVKTYKNLYAPDMSYALVLWATWVHNLFFILFILALAAHIGALVLTPNRPMVRGMLTGTVSLEYARRRHPLWLKELEPEREAPPPVAPEGAATIPGAPEQPPAPVFPDKDAAEADGPVPGTSGER